MMLAIKIITIIIITTIMIIINLYSNSIISVKSQQRFTIMRIGAVITIVLSELHTKLEFLLIQLHTINSLFNFSKETSRFSDR